MGEWVDGRKMVNECSHPLVPRLQFNAKKYKSIDFTCCYSRYIKARVYGDETWQIDRIAYALHDAGYIKCRWGRHWVRY